MARGNFNFKVKAGLETKEFKRGISSMQSMMAKFKSSFSNLAAGIGIGLGLDKLLGAIKDTAVKLDVAQTTLKNVSTVSKTANSDFGKLSATINNYGSNMEFVTELSNKYGQNIITLTKSYAQFIAACKNSSLSLKEQEFIYESLTRAAAAYNMSETQLGDSMNAIIQMISKGKVSMEELRRQLGNNLPGAFQLMSKAQGVSTAQFEKMVSNGEILAQEILPKFAAELNKATQNVNLDNLNTSLNRLQNQWTALVEKMGAKDIYKTLVDNMIDALKHLADNSMVYGSIINSTLKGALLSGVAAILGKSITHVQNYRIDLVREYDFINKEINRLTKSVRGNAPLLWDRTSGDLKVKTTNQELINEAINFNNLLIRRSEIYTEITGKEFKSASINAKGAAKRNALLQAQLATLTQTNSTLTNQRGLWANIGSGIKIAGSGLIGWITKGFKALNAWLGPIGWIILGVQTIAGVWGYIKGNIEKARLEAEKIADIASGSQGKINEEIAPTKQEIKDIKDLFDNFKEFFNSGKMSGAENFYKKLQGIIPALNKISFEELKKKGNAIDFVSNAVDNYTQALLKWAEANSIQSQISTDKQSIIDKQRRVDEIKESGEPLTERKVAYSDNIYVAHDFPTKLGQELNTLEKEIAALKAGIETNQKKLEEIKSDTTIDWKSLNDDEKKPVIPLAELLKTYKADAKELKRLYEEGAITAEDYSEKLNNLNKKAYESAVKDSNFNINDIIKKVTNGEYISTLEQFYYNLAAAVATATADVAYKKVLKELDKEIKKLDKEIDDELEKLADWNKFQKEKIGPRDTTFDYKKSNVDKAADEYDYYTQKVEEAKKEIELLQEVFKNGWNDDGLKQLKNLQGNLDLLTKQAKSWKEAMALEEMAEDLRNFQNELNNIGFNFMDYGMGGLNGVVSTIDGLVSAFERIKELSDDVDATGWEKFMASWGVFETIMDGVFNTFSAVNAIMELSNALTDIQNKKKATLNALLMQENILQAANADVTSTAAGAAGLDAIATEAEAAAAAANTKAKSGEAIANATSSGAKMPFPFNILAIAAGVAAVIAALAAVSKFETGGIVGGNSTKGDKNLARLNSGEMILNKAQQGTLFKAISSGNIGGGGGEWKVKGTDLIKVIDNTKKRMKG